MVQVNEGQRRKFCVEQSRHCLVAKLGYRETRNIMWLYCATVWWTNVDQTIVICWSSRKCKKNWQVQLWRFS